MWIKKSVILALAVSLALGIGPAYAKWHFHGGNVEDIPRRIKEAIDAAKESEVYTQVVTLRDQYKEMKEVWGDFNEAIQGISGTVSDTIHENPLSRLLATGENRQQLRNEMDSRYKFDFGSKGNTKEGRDEAMDKLMAVHEEEFMNTVKTANNTMNLSLELNDQVLDISSDTSGAGFAASQREAGMELALLNAKNQAAAMENQAAVNAIEGDMMEDNFKRYEDYAAASMDMNYPEKDDPVHLDNAKKNRMTSLPR